eukprot:CAMPEP_0116009900 /NCGR_PEP_ID=MMETSP0321-20121206/3697_1 /TAXON_ID=163516 /ORGANISM="Leptocylindrus danicus var. danicus, Strain B650" /LENGTH=509 /DNA_ID=CAMNT_0003478929 /DNA_START=58 /DNA_END=1591 /DNA_ORIENTATION=-
MPVETRRQAALRAKANDEIPAAVSANDTAADEEVAVVEVCKDTNEIVTKAATKRKAVVSDEEGKQDDDADKYVVVTTTYPSDTGCNYGREWSQAELICMSKVEISKEKFDTAKEATELAMLKRDNSYYFQHINYSEDDLEYADSDDEHLYSDNDLPEWNSIDATNYEGNGEEQQIRVMKLCEIKREIATDEIFLNKAQVEKQFERDWEKEVLRLRIKMADDRIGKAHYAKNIRLKEFNIPAELEIDDRIDDFSLPRNITSIKSFWYRAKDGEKEHLFEVLCRCTSLEELYLNAGAGPSEVGEDFFNRILAAAPHLRKTLKVLSFDGTFSLEPSAFKALSKFSRLEHLDLDMALSFMYCDHSNYDVLPYDGVLKECVDKLHHLRRLDIGYEEWDQRRRLYDYCISRHDMSFIGVILAARKGRITFEDENIPNPPPKHVEEATKQHALILISKNKDEKFSEGVALLAEKKLKTCPVCDEEAAKDAPSVSANGIAAKNARRATGLATRNNAA